MSSIPGSVGYKNATGYRRTIIYEGRRHMVWDGNTAGVGTVFYLAPSAGKGNRQVGEGLGRIGDRSRILFREGTNQVFHQKVEGQFG